MAYYRRVFYIIFYFSKLGFSFQIPNISREAITEEKTPWKLNCAVKKVECKMDNDSYVSYYLHLEQSSHLLK